MNLLVRRTVPARIRGMAASSAVICAAAFLSIAASIWEGAANVASSGVLPETGYTAATSAFPRDTIITVTNLENGKFTRVTVAAPLDNRSLLILLSREAAAAIDLPQNRAGRVRIMELVDPVTMLPPVPLDRKTTSGDPDYDPKARIAEFNPTPSDKGAASVVAAPSTTADGTPAAMPAIPPIPEESLFTAGTSEEQPPPIPPPAESDMTSGAAIAAAPPEENGKPAEQPPTETASGTPDMTSAVAVAAAPPEESGKPAEQPPTIAVPEESGSPAKQPPTEVAADTTSGTAVAVAPPAETASGESARHELDNYKLALVPAEDRVPEGKGVSIPSDAEIAPIPPSRPQTAAAEPGKTPDSAYFVDPVEPPASARPVSHDGRNFSVPVFATMEKGVYYVQLRSYRRPELVESELSKLTNIDNVSVQVADLSGRPIYRVMIGPVSKSESAQLVRQYKERGWTDAFVWLGK